MGGIARATLLFVVVPGQAAVTEAQTNLILNGNAETSLTPEWTVTGAAEIVAYGFNGASSSTTTTTPGDPCTTTPAAATFFSLNCRLAALLAQVQAAAAAGQLGPFATKLPQQLAKAKQRKKEAEAACLWKTAFTKLAKGRLTKAIRKLSQFKQTLDSRRGRQLDAALRETLGLVAEGIRAHMAVLRGALRCPEDAASG